MTTFNLKIFVEEFSIARESGDIDEEAGLMKKFIKFFCESTTPIQKASQTYLLNNPIAKQYSDLQLIAHNGVEVSF